MKKCYYDIIGFAIGFYGIFCFAAILCPWYRELLTFILALTASTSPTLRRYKMA